MRKQRTFEELNGRMFEVKAPSSYVPRFDYGSIFSAYGRPSLTKCRIWSDWCGWFNKLWEQETNGMYDEKFEMWVSSHNCNFFTIGGKFLHNGKQYAFYITATRQEIWELV